MSEVNGNLALVMGGGGARAAYQVGVLCAITRRYPTLEIPILTGVSAGAINTAFLATQAGSLDTSIERLAELYLAKARVNGGGDIETEAIDHYFREINTQIRWVEDARLVAEPDQLRAVLEFADEHNRELRLSCRPLQRRLKRADHRQQLPPSRRSRPVRRVRFRRRDHRK